MLRTLRGECTEYYLPPPVGDKKTLVLDLDETLIHSSRFPPHSRVDAFRVGDPEFYVFKRPGLEEFLKFARDNFEVFIFTYGEERYAKPIIDHLMPWLDDQHRLYREACDGRKGPSKDLRIFERARNRLILIDDSESALSLNPQNTVQISKWQGVPWDRALIDLLPPILKKCLEVDDVREVIKETHIPMVRKDVCDGILIDL
jgi:Dullard-like phosphatase family protein